jgi:hypothetical protein
MKLGPLQGTHHDLVTLIIIGGRQGDNRVAVWLPIILLLQLVGLVTGVCVGQVRLQALLHTPAKWQQRSTCVQTEHMCQQKHLDADGPHTLQQCQTRLACGSMHAAVSSQQTKLSQVLHILLLC